MISNNFRMIIYLKKLFENRDKFDSMLEIHVFLNGQSDSSQELSGKSFMRMTCAAHTAIKDFFNDIEFHFV